MTSARNRWEKAFEKKMSHDEFVMFSWGYAYALRDYLESENSEASR